MAYMSGVKRPAPMAPINSDLGALDVDANESDSDATMCSTPRFDATSLMKCIDSIGSETEEVKMAPTLTVEAFRASLGHVSDFTLLFGLKDELDKRCKELEQEVAIEKLRKQIPVSASALLNITLVDDGDIAPKSSMKVSDWTMGRELGKGRFATVFAAKNNASGRNEAVKVICKSEVAVANDWNNVASEFEIMSSMQAHPNIVCLTGAAQSQKRLFFFIDIAMGKDLFEFIKLRQQTRRPVAKEAIEVISTSILSALAHCHKNGVCHRDMKPENIIVQQDYTAKLVDFGCACPRHQLQGQCIGTMPFIAPEFLSEQAHDGAPADVWAFGVVILEMKFGLRAMTRFMEWDKDHYSTRECGAQLAAALADPFEAVLQMRSKMGVGSDVDGDDVLARMLHADPQQRPCAEELI